jgi:hypothetical protein
MVKMLNIVEIGEQYLKIEIVKIVKMVNNVLNDQIRTMVVMVKMLTKTYKFKVIVKVNLIKVIWDLVRFIYYTEFYLSYYYQ